MPFIPRKLDLSRTAFALAALCGAAGLAFLACGVIARPYGAVEAEMVFEASRIRSHFPLYVDPTVGAWEAGAPPSRYYVLYTPLWPWILAHLSPRSLVGTRTVGRLLNVALFLGTLGAAARAARPGNRGGVATVALLTLGLEMLAREAGLADADMPAVALSTFGLLRMNRRGGLDGTSCALLALAPLVKPSVLGGVAGALLAHVLVNRKGGLRALVGPCVPAAIVSCGLVAIFHVWSHGVWLEHIVRATGQTLSFDRWVNEFGSRAWLLGAPHAAVLLLAARRGASPLSTVPLATSLGWAVFSMAKHGSGTHYWLEPTMAALVALGAMPPAVDHRATALGWPGLAVAVGVAVSSLPSFLRGPAQWRAWPALMDRIREACPRTSGEVVMAYDARIELELDGRILVPAWQNAYLIRRGAFPLAAWREDLARPEVRCFVHDRSLLDPPPERITGVTEVGPYRKELRDVVLSLFVLDRAVGPLLIFLRR
jgi:hypothetical protein